MFGRSKPSPFKPYAFGAKPKRRFPRWLLWLLIGVVLGIAGVLFVQEEYLPPRLSAGESRQLTEQYNQASLALQQTRSQLDETRETLAAQQAERATLAEELDKARTGLKPLQNDLAMLKDALPPDPRGGTLQIRAARFFNRDGGMDYHVVLTREASGTFEGGVQFAVEGRYPSGRTGTVTLDPVGLTLSDYENVHGVLPLPDNMQARQITIRVLDGNGRMQAMRVINARN
ncbi:hypothetical protein IMZ29_02865 [Achromobacter sp. GG226]|uniref:hypothetical protein n=1 Tax=Verticiella alkaliphila TaxID=2779529 RepID=UPI001C0AE58F|nr:hypothetical protein [Verticiella sp. GG226]MBU4609524.1 hypothetical protein [Verticiella sp. GG226]